MSTASTGNNARKRAALIQRVVAFHGVLVPPKTYITERQVELYLANTVYGWGSQRAKELLGDHNSIGASGRAQVEAARMTNTAFDRLLTKLENCIITRRPLYRKVN